MADKRISQLVERTDIANNDVVPIVAFGASTTNKATISSIQTFMQGNLDLGVTSVGITIGSTGTDINVTGSPVTSSGNITINLPTASAVNRGALSSADWTTFNSKQQAITLTTTGTSGAATLVSGALNIPNYSTDLSGYVTLGTTQTITAQKTFTTSGSSDTMIISHGSGSGFALDVLKAGNGEAIRVTKSSGSGNAMTISGGNFEAPTIVKTGGTSSQFLKADGSVDSSTYLTTASAGTTYVPYTGAGANVDLGIYNLTANAVNVNASGSNAGVINLESNTIFSLVNGYGTIGSGTTNQFNFYQTTGAGVFRGAILSLNSITASATRTYTLPDADGTLALTSSLGAYLPLAGGTLTGALNGTSGSFNGLLSTTAGNGLLVGGSGFAFAPTATRGSAQIVGSTDRILAFGSNGNQDAYIYNSASVFQVVSTPSVSFAVGGVERFNINASTGAATFSSSVTASSLIAASATFSNFGSATAAVVGFGDENTGFFRPAANSLSITTNGVQRQIINSDGAMGFNYPILGSRSFVFRTISGRPLTLETIAPTGIHSLYLRPNDSGRHLISSNYLSGGVYLPLALSGRENDSDLVLGINGNVGIGTATPDSRLSVFGTFRNYLSSGAGGQTLISAILGVSNGYLINVDTSNNITHTWHTGANAVSMQITSGGNVTIGDSSTSNTGKLNYASPGVGSFNGVLELYHSTTNVSGSGFVNFYVNTSVIGSIGQLGTTAVVYNTTSDYRLKEDLQEVKGLEKVQAIKVYDYKWITDDFRMDGVLAHELAEVLPYAVTGEKDEVNEDGTDKMQGVDYSKIVPILIKAIQEQQEQINQLKNQIK